MISHSAPFVRQVFYACSKKWGVFLSSEYWKTDTYSGTHVVYACENDPSFTGCCLCVTHLQRVMVYDNTIHKGEL